MVSLRNLRKDLRGTRARLGPETWDRVRGDLVELKLMMPGADQAAAAAALENAEHEQVRNSAWAQAWEAVLASYRETGRWEDVVWLRGVRADLRGTRSHLGSETWDRVRGDLVDLKLMKPGAD